MFDSTNINYSPTRNIVSNHVNAVSGSLVKTYTKSFFQRVKLDDPVLGIDPHVTIVKREYSSYNGGYWDNKTKVPVVVIQVMLCGNDSAIVEIMKTDDYKEVQ